MNFDKIDIPVIEARPFQGDSRLIVTGEALSLIAERAFSRLSFTFTREHLERLASIALDDTATHNDRMVTTLLLENAVIAAKNRFALCQDTGIANIFAWKDNAVATEGDDSLALSAGSEYAYRARNLRFSTTVPDSLFEEHDPGNNMPAQVLISSGSQNKPGAFPAYRFLFCAKGGGSSNKTSFTQGTKAILNPASFERFLRAQIAQLGSAACPPYSLAIVVGGVSPEQNILALKLATAGYFDETLAGWDYRVLGSVPLRDKEWEATALRIAAESGIGAQFGGKGLAISARVLRLPRHGASCPLSVGVSCSSHRNLHGYIDQSGIYLETTECDPLSVPDVAKAIAVSGSNVKNGIAIRLDEGIEASRAALSGLAPGTPVFLSGKVLVARDAAHARWRKALKAGEGLPGYAVRYPIIYAGPAETPPGCVTGSFGPTTAGRMDDYAEELMGLGAALITVAKGNRSERWRKACADFGATYLGTIGGAAALIAEKYILSSELIDYPDLGMEAVRLVELRGLPAFILINDRGEDFYRDLASGQGAETSGGIP